MTSVFIFILGLIFGSFLSVVFSRLETAQKAARSSKKQAPESIVTGRSRCDDCRKQIAWYDNIPLVSYLLLRAKCRHCDKPISAYHPVLELSSGLWLLTSYLGFGLSAPFFVAGAFGLVLLLIFSYDLRYSVIPNAVVLPAIAAAIILLIVQAALFYNGSAQNALLFSANPLDYVAGGVIGGGFFLFLSLVSRGRWIGGGDIKLGFLLGLLLGWPFVVVAFVVAYLIGTGYALTLLAARQAQLGTMVPFGPMLVMGFFTTVFSGESLIRWYQGWFIG